MGESLRISQSIRRATTWAAALSFVLQAQAQDFSLPSPISPPAKKTESETFSLPDPRGTSGKPRPAPESPQESTFEPESFATPVPAPAEKKAAPPSEDKPSTGSETETDAEDKAQSKETKPQIKKGVRVRARVKKDSKETSSKEQNPKEPTSKVPSSKEANPKESPAKEPEKKIAEEPKPSEAETKIPTAVIRGIIDGKLRFSPKEFSDLKKGQILVVESKNAGEIAARIEITSVNKTRTTASAKVTKTESGFDAADLVGLTVYRESDYNKKYAQTDIAAVVAPKPILGRNHMLAAHLNLIFATSNAANVMTGLDLNQESQTIAVEFEGFIPESLGGQLGNKFGLKLSYGLGLPSTVVGRVASTDETQTFKLSSNEIRFAAVYKSRAKSGSLSQYWAKLGYAILNTDSAWETNVGSGNTNIALSLKGLEIGLGGDFSPLPFLYLGGEFVAGIPQKWNSTDTGNNVSRTGSWNTFLTSAYTELRYPVGRAKTDLFTFQVKGGLSIDQIQNSSSSASKKENFTTPVFVAGIGYFTK